MHVPDPQEVLQPVYLSHQLADQHSWLLLQHVVLHPGCRRMSLMPSTTTWRPKILCGSELRSALPKACVLAVAGVCGSICSQISAGAAPHHSKQRGAGRDARAGSEKHPAGAEHQHCRPCGEERPRGLHPGALRECVLLCLTTSCLPAHRDQFDVIESQVC